MAVFVVCLIHLSGSSVGGGSGIVNTSLACQPKFNLILNCLVIVVNEYYDSASAKSMLQYLVSDTNCDIFISKLRHRAPIDAATTMGIPVDEIRNGKRSYEELEAVYKEMLARIKKIG